MEFTTFEDYYEYYTSKIDSYPHRDDFMRVLEWSADKPKGEYAFSELAPVIDAGEGNPMDELMTRVLSVSVILAGWAHPIASPFFKVLSDNGEYYDVGLQEQAVYDGKKSFVLPQTGETIENFPSRAYMHLRFNDFEPRRPSHSPSVGPRP